MSTPDEKREAIRQALEVAKRRLAELNQKPRLTRSEEYERDMTLGCIQRGEHLLRTSLW